MDKEKLTICDSTVDVRKNEPTASSSKVAVTTTTSQLDRIRQRRHIAQNFLLIWMDDSINQSGKDYQNIMAQLQNVVNDVNIFTQLDECVDFLTDIDGVKVFLVVAGALDQQMIPVIHDIPQLDCVYVFCADKLEHAQWTEQWIKVKGVHKDIATICESLQQVVKQCNQDSIAVSFVLVDEEAVNQSLDQLEPSFMYTQIFKEILLEMQYNENSIKDFITYCRSGNYGSPNNITRFENEYQAELAIWCYTFPSFIYSILNGALRTMEADTMIKMGFYIRDLHDQIEHIYQQQIRDYHGQPFIVYRGQGLSITDFQKLLKTKGGLISFNNFLSTSKNPVVSRGFADIALTQMDKVGILFKIYIDPSISSVPFASIQEVGYYVDEEEEILFSMHTVFRIDEITRIDDNSLIYQVDLKLTADDDQQLRILTQRIREEIDGVTGWQQLGQLLLIVSRSDKAEELYNTLLEEIPDEGEKAYYYHQLGYVKCDQGDFEKAVEYYEIALEIQERTLPPDHPALSTSYNNIGLVYNNMGEYVKALSFHRKDLEITQNTFPQNYPRLGVSCNNIGAVYRNMGEYSEALSFYEKALEIGQKILPPNHPDLTTCHNNIAVVYYNMGEYSKALSLYEKALEINQKTLPPNHPALGTSYNNIAEVYRNTGEYFKALSFYEKALEIYQKIPLPNHPLLATCYNNIGLMFDTIGEYSKALLIYEKALEIDQKVLPPTHPDLAASYNNIGLVYNNMKEYSKALSFYEKSLEIFEKTLSPNHSNFAHSYNNIAGVYVDMGEYSKALLFYQRALNIFLSSLPSNHPDVETVQENIEYVKKTL